MRHAYFDNKQIAKAAALDWNLWMRWIFANTVGELIGLGVVALTGALFFLYFDKSPSAGWSAFATAFLMISTGAFEGAAVGYFQGNVLKTRIRTFDRRRWMIATIFGAVAAWILGTIPSLLMSLSEQPQNSPAFEPDEATVALLAAGMGFALGIVLGLPQWFELRRYMKNAGWWLPANALGWTVGMPQLFAAPSAIVEGLPAWQIVFIIFTAIISAGASVGAIHGLVLIRLLQNDDINIAERSAQN